MQGRSRFLLAALVLIVVSAGSVIAGTQLDDDEASGQSLEVRQDGSLKVDPAPLSLRDVRKEQEGSAPRKVVELWFWAQWGSAPNIVASYAPRIVSALSPEDLSGAYASKRASMLATRPRIVNSVTTSAGTTLTVDALRRNASPERLTFTLQRSDGRWQIVYDSVLEEGIAAYTQNLRDSTGKPTEAAVRAGIEAARAYRRAALGS